MAAGRVTTSVGLMTTLPSITMPCFTDAEREALRRIEGILARHPYMRADLGGSGPLARALEEVMSARLALLHTEGSGSESGELAILLGKLRDWEAGLLCELEEDADSDGALLRYETTRLLHPEPAPDSSPDPASSALAHVTREWERARAARPFKALLAEKLQQNRDFVRHGVMLPLYWWRRRRIRKWVPSTVLDHPALRATYFAIEQVGPLVDNFAFKGAAGVPLGRSVAVADIAFLYMQLADEFLDELAAAAGGHAPVGRLVHSLYRSDTSARPLPDLSLSQIEAIGVDPRACSTKFDISLASLFAVLEELGGTIDALLADAKAPIIHSANLFLHHCFQTYLDEIDLRASAPDARADSIPLRDAAWHFYRKNNMVMMLWLDLRARLLGLQPDGHASAIRRWGYLLATFQIFDDLKDIALDLGKQPSYPLQIAANDFPDERTWLEHRFAERRAPVTRDEVVEVSFSASRTVRQCMAWSRLMALSQFDNALLYACDQRWRKSWTERRGSFNPGPRRAPGVRLHAVDRLVRALVAMRDQDEDATVDDERLAFALDAAAYDGASHIYLALFPNLRAMYRFATLRMWMSVDEKAGAARQLLRRYPRARASALVCLADADVDHQVGGDRLEAFSKLIEV